MTDHTISVLRILFVILFLAFAVLVGWGVLSLLSAPVLRSLGSGAGSAKIEAVLITVVPAPTIDPKATPLPTISPVEIARSVDAAAMQAANRPNASFQVDAWIGALDGILVFLIVIGLALSAHPTCVRRHYKLLYGAFGIAACIAAGITLFVLSPGSDLSLTELKYRLIDNFGGMSAQNGIFYCDPNYYPVQRVEVEQAEALGLFPDIAKNTEEFSAILHHANLLGLTSFSEEQKVLIYREHKKLRMMIYYIEPLGGIYRFKFGIQREKQNPTEIAGLINRAGTIMILQQTPASYLICPTCLARNTRIDTPQRQIAVENLHEGMPIWTTNAAGVRVSGIILKTTSVFVLPNHQMVYLRLDDRRNLLASPGHPTADGRAVGDLQPGDVIDGAHVVSVEQIPYDEAATYDILPSGNTGFYWANDVLIGSALSVPPSETP